MNLKKYFNSEAVYEKYINSSNQFGVDTYAPEEKIKCRIEGQRRFVNEEDGTVTISNQTYLTLHDVNERDKINGQYIKAVAVIYDFNGKPLYREAIV